MRTTCRTLSQAFETMAALLCVALTTAPASRAAPICKAEPLQVVAPDTLVLTSSLMADGKADVILPIGGLYDGKWLSGEAWRHRLPKQTQTTIFSLTQGRVGCLRITGPDRLFPPPEFSGWRGTYQVCNSEGKLLAIWRRSDPPVKWARAKVLKADSVHYKGIARDYMVAHGLPEYLGQHGLPPQLDERVEVSQAVAVDLDYDGKDEKLLSANWCELNGPGAPRFGSLGVGIRSYVLLVRDGGRAMPSVIALSGPEDFAVPEEVIGCVDLDLDGKAEVVTRCPTAHEGYRIYKWAPPKVMAHYDFFYGE